MSTPRFLDGPTGEHLQALLTSAREAPDADTQAWRLLSLQRAITTALAERPGRAHRGFELGEPGEGLPFDRAWAFARTLRAAREESS